MNVRPILFAILAGALLPAGCSSGSYDGTPRRVDPAASETAVVHDENEDLWIIEKADPARSDEPRGGRLWARRREQLLPIPLKHTEVRGRITLFVGSVTVRQQYHNPYDEKIEAVYTFPLPADAAVRDFVMTVGARRIRGIVRERQEARRLYEKARAQGYRASLMTQERPNIFTQSVANIEPGREIDVAITYFHTLPYEDGSYVFHFPMTVGPRFNPAGAAAPVSDPPYLGPTEITRHEIDLELKIDAGVPVETFESPTHDIEVAHEGRRRAVVRLAPGDRIPNRDFVLRYQVAGRELQGALATTRDATGGYFALMLQPPAKLEGLPAADREMIFVLDCSGSMEGQPLALAKTALKNCLRRLDPDDTFQIVRFSDSASSLGRRLMPATEENVQRAIRYVDGLSSEGGTMMLEGIKTALGLPHDPERLRIVTFLTDGYIGNDQEIIGEVKRRMGEARLFSFGIGSSVNRFLLDGMARAGRGAALYVTLDESGARAAEQFFTRIEHPAMTHLSIDWGSMEVSELQPMPLPDLMVGRPVVLTGRFEGVGATTVRVRGRAAGRPVTLEIPLDLDEPDARHEALASVWARQKIATLQEAMAWAPGRENLAGQIRTLALQYGLVSPYTSFIAVDGSERTEGDHGTTVPVPVHVPKGVPYDTRGTRP